MEGSSSPICSLYGYGLCKGGKPHPLKQPYEVSWYLTKQRFTTPVPINNINNKITPSYNLTYPMTVVPWDDCIFTCMNSWSLCLNLGKYTIQWIHVGTQNGSVVQHVSIFLHNYFVVEPTHLKNITVVKLDHLPRDRGENKKIFETTIQITVGSNSPPPGWNRHGLGDLKF